MSAPSDRAVNIGALVEKFVRDVVAPYERDPRCGPQGPSDDLVAELRGLARAAGLVAPHILADGSHLDQRETAYALQRSGLSPLGPIAVNTAVPDEGNMYLLGKGDTIVEQVFHEIRAFRIYDGPTEVHKWSLAKKINRDWQAARA